MLEIGRSPESRKKSRAFLQAVFDADGRAATSQIREATGLSRGEIKYRYDLLEEIDLISIEYDEMFRRDPQEAAQKIAILSELAHTEIDKGLLQGGQYQPSSDPTVEDLAQDIAETQEYISENLYPLISEIESLRGRVHELESERSQ